jgi:hypothetical protein
LSILATIFNRVEIVEQVDPTGKQVFGRVRASVDAEDFKLKKIRMKTSKLNNYFFAFVVKMF